MSWADSSMPPDSRAGLADTPRYRELLQAVLEGQTAPVCPVFAFRHFPHSEDRPSAFASAHWAWFRQTDPDLWKLSPPTTWQLRDYGLVDEPIPDDGMGRRRITRTVIASPQDWFKLPPLVPGTGATAPFIQALTMMAAAQPIAPLLMTILAPVSQAAKLAGAERLALHVAQAPDAVAAGLERITRNTVALIERLSGLVSGVFVAVQHAQGNVVDAATYARLFLPHDLACLQAADALPFNMLHLHGHGVHAQIYAAAPAFAGLSSPPMLHFEVAPDNPDPAALLRQGLRVAAGPSPFGTIHTGTAAMMRAEAEAFLQLYHGPRFVLGVGCALPLNTPLQTIAALYSAARTPRFTTAD